MKIRSVFGVISRPEAFNEEVQKTSIGFIDIKGIFPAYEEKL